MELGKVHGSTFSEVYPVLYWNDNKNGEKKNGIFFKGLGKEYRGPLYFTVWTVIFTVSVVKITVHTVKCTEAHRNFSTATSKYSNVTNNYSNAVFCVYNF